MPYTPSQVARIVGVSVQSVRNWTTDYAPLLSPAARGNNGTRSFDDADLEAVRTIALLRNSGMAPAEILRRMQDDSAPPVIDIAPQQSPQDAHSAPQTALVALSSLQEGHNALQARLEGIERTQNMLLRAALWWGVLLGAIAALAVGSFVLWVLWLAANGL